MNPKQEYLVNEKYSLQDLVDIEHLREMFENFSQATGFTTELISYPEQKQLICTGWRKICTKFHQAFPGSKHHCKQSNLELTSHIKEQRKINIHHCKIGLIEGSIPIIVKGTHIANILTGQVFFKKPDIEHFKKQCEEYGYDIETYLMALHKVPVVTEKAFKKTLEFLGEMTVTLAEKKLLEIKNSEIAQDAQEREERFRTAFESAKDCILIRDKNYKPICNPDGSVCVVCRDITDRKQIEEERREHVLFLENLERIAQVITQSMNLENMMNNVLDSVLSIFDCDRAWLLYPCDPEASTWRIPMEKTKPEYPGACILNKEYAMTPNVSEILRKVLARKDPVIIDFKPKESSWDPKDKYSVRSAMAIAITPKTGKPWKFGLHQCSYTRTWTKTEQRLFKEISQRLSDSLSSLLFFRNLTQNEKQYRLLAENAPEAIAVLDIDTGIFVDANEKAEQLFGLSREKLLNSRLVDISPSTQPDGRSSQEAAMNFAIQAFKGNPQIFEWIHLNSSTGKKILCEVRLVRFPSSERRLVRGSIVDITLRKRIENNRKHLNRINQLIISSTNLNQLLKDVLNTMLEIFGSDRAWLLYPCDPKVNFFRIPMECTRPEWPGASLQNIEIPLDPVSADTMKDALTTNDPLVYDSLSKRKIANEIVEAFYVKSQIIMQIQPKEGKSWLLGMHQCSYDRIWIPEEQELFKEIGHSISQGLTSLLLYQKLVHTRNYMKNIINSMPSILIGVDLKYKITQWNRHAEKETNIKAEDAIGKYLKDTFPGLTVEIERVDKAIKSRQTLSNFKQTHQKTGEPRYEDVTIYPLIANGVEGAVILIDDVTDKIRMEEMMIQSEKMLSVGGLAAGMAHEINNPLAGMMQTASVIANRLDKTNMPANQKAAKAEGTTMESIRNFMDARDIPRMITTINESGHRIAEIVNNMLSFARKSDARIASYSIAEIMDKTLELAATDYDLKKHYDFKVIKIKKEYKNNLPSVPCERAKIQQVLLNILRNGAQAMEEDNTEKAQFTIRTGFETEGKMVFIEIEDNGPGMDEQTRKRVFEPFFTTKPVGLGTGLGLSVSYFIITKNHGGEMAVESQAGHGAKFIIRLPSEREIKNLT